MLDIFALAHLQNELIAQIAGIVGKQDSIKRLSPLIGLHLPLAGGIRGGVYALREVLAAGRVATFLGKYANPLAVIASPAIASACVYALGISALKLLDQPMSDEELTQMMDDEMNKAFEHFENKKGDLDE